VFLSYVRVVDQLDEPPADAVLDRMKTLGA